MKIQNVKSKLVNNMLGYAMSVALMLLPALLPAQSTQEQIYAVADEMPAFPGGTKALIETIYKNVVYPADARSLGIEGKVVIKFVVNKEGKAVDPTVSKGLYPSIDQSVIDAIKKLPKFEPGKLGGKAVNVWYAVPVTFKLLQ